jgi:excisionase family DNA binding protein
MYSPKETAIASRERGRWPIVAKVSVQTASDALHVQPLLLTIPQVMKYMSLGRSKVYDLIQKEGLLVQHFGRAVRIPYGDLQQWLEDRK